MNRTRLDLTRSQILAFRQQANALGERLPPGPRSLEQAAWAGLQDSMPRAALLSIHARVEGTEPDTWADPSLVQIWGPRFSVFAVAARDLAIFTLGLNHPNRLRYAAATGTVLIRWAGARQATVWSVPRPEADPSEARLELARRYLHIYGPTTPEAFGQWSGISARYAAAAFAALGGSLTPVQTPVGEAWILARDEAACRADPGPVAPARLLPSGDAYLLLQGTDRELMVPDADQRAALWTPRVWPGGLLIGGEVTGTWRRADASMTVQTWRPLSAAERDAVVAEAESLPLPGTGKRISVRWAD